MIKKLILVASVAILLGTESQAGSRSRQNWSFIGGVVIGAALSNSSYCFDYPYYSYPQNYYFRYQRPCRNYYTPYYYPSQPRIVIDPWGRQRIIPGRM